MVYISAKLSGDCLVGILISTKLSGVFNSGFMVYIIAKLSGEFSRCFMVYI